MQGYDETLKDLTEKMKNKDSVTRKLSMARTQRVALRNKVDSLKTQYQREAKDVANLEGRGVAALFYAALGKKEEKLDKERAEAFAAKAKYDAAQYELASIENDISFYEGEIAQFTAYEAEYKACFAKKAAAMRAAGGQVGEQLLALEATIADSKHQQKELREAIDAGNAGLALVAQIEEHLGSAKDWGTWDVIGGGILTDMAKHDHLDKAQALVQRLQSQLRRFQTELADVQVSSNLQISVNGFLGFADFFLDGLFVDWMVLDKINSASEQVAQTKKQIRGVQTDLYRMRTVAEENLAKAEKERDAIVLKV